MIDHSNSLRDVGLNWGLPKKLIGAYSVNVPGLNNRWTHLFICFSFSQLL